MWQWGQHLILCGGVLYEILVVVGVVDGRSWVVASQVLTITLAESIVVGTTVDGKVGNQMDKRPGLGIRTGGGSIPEGTAQVDGSV